MKERKLISLSSLVLCLLLGGCKSSSITLTLEPDQDLITGTPIAIDVKTAPFPSRIDPNSIVLSGGDSWVEDGKIKFQAEEAGNYTVSVNQDNVQSNDLNFTVGDRYTFFNNREASQANAMGSSQNSAEETTIQSGQMVSVDQVYAAQDELINHQTSVIVEGNLPQALLTDKKGEQVQALWNDTTSQYLILEGFKIPFGSCKADVTGTLSKDDAGQLVLHMTYISTAEQPGVVHSENQDSSQTEDNSKTS